MSKTSGSSESPGPARRRPRSRAWAASGRARYRAGLVLLTAVVLVIGGAFIIAKQAPDPVDPVSLGERLPGMQLHRLDGAIQRFDAYRGKTTIVNIWATWCAPCRAELPSLQRLRDQLDPGRYAVIGISIDEDPDFVREYLRDLGVTYANYLDRTRGLTDGVLGVRSYPQTLFIGPDGRLLQRVVGSREWDHPDAIAAIQGQ